MRATPLLDQGPSLMRATPLLDQGPYIMRATPLLDQGPYIMRATPLLDQGPSIMRALYGVCDHLLLSFLLPELEALLLPSAPHLFGVQGFVLVAVHPAGILGRTGRRFCARARAHTDRETERQRERERESTHK